MHTEATKDKKDEAKSTDFGFGPMGQGMFKMMSECCTGQGGFPDCSTIMKGMMEAMKNQSCCAPKKEGAEFEKGRHESAKQ